MWQIETKFSVRLGGNTYVDTPNLVTFRGNPIFRIRRGDDGMLGIDFEVFDAGGKRVATFAKGVVVSGDEANYQITTGHEAYSVTDRATGQVIASVRRRGVDGAELDVNVRMHMPNGFLLDATPDGTNLGGIAMRGNVFRNCATAIAID